MKVVVCSSEKYLWALRPFAYLFNKFWSQMQSVDVVTGVRPAFDLPGNFNVVSPSNGLPIAKNNWSDALITYLGRCKYNKFVLLLEDYWLVRIVDVGGVSTLLDYMRRNPDIVRMDLTADRQFSGQAKDAGFYGHYDLVETPSPSEYQLSLQAALWDRAGFLSVLQSNWSAWDVELTGTHSLNESDYRIFGTKQHPVRYANALHRDDNKGVIELQMDQISAIPAEHLNHIKSMVPSGMIK